MLYVLVGQIQQLRLTEAVSYAASFHHTCQIHRWSKNVITLAGYIKKSEGNHPLAKVKPISPVMEAYGMAKIVFYFRLSNTCLMALVAISGITLI